MVVVRIFFAYYFCTKKKSNFEIPAKKKKELGYSRKSKFIKMFYKYFVEALKLRLKKN